ncbi:MAG TPA: exonuclease domain-containing protein [Salinimicrobium sp.]|nr:exonuclease domain-containing protein [Salinimicrobium sp.]
MYAILDIETTGGKYNEEGITEIAIYKFDGHEVVDQFISLINPEIAIQPFVVKLTGINNDMLRSAPKFYQVAKRIIEITTNCVIVAHNAKFDCRILSTEFKRLGYDFAPKSLCTVELSKKLIPGQKSYSLGKLVRALGIPLSDRHRASGDAQATVKLFKMLMAKDVEKEILGSFIRTTQKIQLDSKLINLLRGLPTSPGVYYFYNSENEIIYIGKSKNIKKRITQHFTNENRKSRQIQKEISSLSFELTGNELNALLKENEEIKRNKPKYNHALTRSVFNYALYQKKDENGYLHLEIGKADGRKKNITTFTNLQQGKNILNNIVDEYELCQSYTGLYSGSGSCFNHTIKKCKGACIQIECPEDYNQRVSKVIDKYCFDNRNMLIIDKGREIDEKSALLIEEGEFKGMGYFNLNYQLNNIEIIKSIITPMKTDRYVQHIISNYLRKNNRLQIISFGD